jgi:hypothetical protein
MDESLNNRQSEGLTYTTLWITNFHCLSIMCDPNTPKDNGDDSKLARVLIEWMNKQTLQSAKPKLDQLPLRIRFEAHLKVERKEPFYEDEGEDEIIKRYLLGGKVDWNYVSDVLKSKEAYGCSNETERLFLRIAQAERENLIWKRLSEDAQDVAPLHRHKALMRDIIVQCIHSRILNLNSKKCFIRLSLDDIFYLLQNAKNSVIKPVQVMTHTTTQTLRNGLMIPNASKDPTFNHSKLLDIPVIWFMARVKEYKNLPEYRKIYNKPFTLIEYDLESIFDEPLKFYFTGIFSKYRFLVNVLVVKPNSELDRVCSNNNFPGLDLQQNNLFSKSKDGRYHSLHRFAGQEVCVRLMITFTVPLAKGRTYQMVWN